MYMKRVIAVVVFMVVISIAHIDASKAATVTEVADLCNAVHEMHTRDAYVPAGFRVLFAQGDRPLDPALFPETLPENSCGFQGIAFEEISTGNVFAVFGGTEGMDLEDLLADLGVASNEIKSVIEAIAYLFGQGRDGTRDAQVMDAERARAILAAAGKRRLDSPKETVLAQLYTAWSFYRRAEERLSRRDAFEYIDGRCAQSPAADRQVIVSGHSLGGYLAQVVSALSGRHGYTFNAPGASGLCEAVTAKCVNYRREHDLVGIFGKKVGPEVCFPDVPVQLSNFPKPFFIRNHLIKQFLGDLRAGMQPLSKESPTPPERPFMRQPAVAMPSIVKSVYPVGNKAGIIFREVK